MFDTLLVVFFRPICFSNAKWLSISSLLCWFN